MKLDPEKSTREIFLHAVEIEDVQSREQYLKNACQGDAKLLEQVRRLIRTEEEAGLSEEIAVSVERIGPYKLLQHIGEGGCGVVYMAEQSEPVHRRVALKIIKLGMDTCQVVARFEAERQALAMMDHPNIARVLDAGATNTGRPYFVMELVRGTRITDYCDRAHLDTRARLKLFTRVCQAVQHAHQKGIIHRDLKPSNILVTDVDSVPTPKIIDFGIAKAMEGRLTDKTLFTAFEQLIGTPAYMSPEQATVTAADIDTRTDIYSLGVLLYELLSGQTPFDGGALMESGVDALRRTIQEKEPQRPSTRISLLELDRITSIARSRNTGATKLASLIEGDLDWITMKCLEKDRRRRYGSAESLAADLERHLESQPIQARPPTLLYTLQRAFRRNRLAFGAASAVALSLIVGLIATLWQFREKDLALERAQAAEHEQSRLREEAQAANERSSRDLRQSLVSQAHLATLSGTVGRRDNAVSALTQASRIRPTAEMVEIAITALSMFQVRELGVSIPRLESGFEIAMDPNLTRYAWHGGERTNLVVRSLPGHQEVQAFSRRKSGILDFVEWLPDGERIAIRERNGPLHLWNVRSDTLEWTRSVIPIPYASQGHFIGTLASGPSGDVIAHIEPDSRVEIIRTSDGERAALLQMASRPSSLAFHPREPWIAVGSETGIDIVDWQEDRVLFSRNTGNECTGLSWSPDGEVIAHTGWSYKLELWAVAGEPKLVDSSLGGFMLTPVYSDDGEWIAGSDSRGILTLWHGHSGDPIVEDLGGFPVAFSDDGSRLLRRSGDSGVSTYELSEAACYFELAVPFYADFSLPGLAISPDERWVAATSYSSGVYLWDLEKGGAPRRSDAFGVSSAMFDASGSHFLTCSEKGVQLWDFVETATGGKLVGRDLSEGGTGSSRYMTHTFASDRRVIVSTKQSVWSFPRSNFSSPTKHPSRDQQSAAISPDGRWLVESSFYSPVYLYDLEEKQPADDISPDGGLVSFSPDGKLLTVGRGGKVEGWDTKSWDTKSWDKAWEISTQTVKQTTGLCVFRPQGDVLATLGDAQDILLLRPSDGKLLVRLASSRPGNINRIYFSDSGRLLLASTENGRVQVWRLDELEKRLGAIGLDWGALNGMPNIAE